MFPYILCAALVAEIKELKEKRQQEDNVLLSVATGCRNLITPHLKFDYSDTDIHEDIYKLIKYSCDEICTSKEQSNKAMRLWRTFLEPMLSVPPRPLNCEDSGAALVCRHRGIKTAATNIRGRDGGLGTDAATMNSKLSKSLSNDHESIYPDKKDSVLKSGLHGNILAKEDGFCPQKDVKHTAIVDKGPGSNGKVASAECSASSDAAVAVGRDIVPCRLSWQFIFGSHVSGLRLVLFNWLFHCLFPGFLIFLIFQGEDAIQMPLNRIAERGHGVTCNVECAVSLEV